MSEATLSIEPITPRLGAEVFGVDLSQALSNAEVDALKSAFTTYAVLVFRNQKLDDPDDLKAAARNFGSPMRSPFVEPMPGHPEIIDIIKEASEVGAYNFGGDWHSDITFEPEPAMGALLYAVDLPSVGGDTLFADQRQAWNTLSDAMKAKLDGVRAIHTAKRSYGTASKFKGDKPMAAMTVAKSEDAHGEVMHPLVRTHPETGAKGLFVNPNYTTGIEGWSEEEAKPLLDMLCRHTIRDEFVCRVRWKPGTAVLWDNRCVMHRALNDYDGHRRNVRRVTLAGDRPV